MHVTALVRRSNILTTFQRSGPLGVWKVYGTLTYYLRNIDIPFSMPTGVGGKHENSDTQTRIRPHTSCSFVAFSPTSADLGRPRASARHDIDQRHRPSNSDRQEVNRWRSQAEPLGQRAPGRRGSAEAKGTHRYFACRL